MKHKLTTPSLAQYFNAPEDYIGGFGWICGYSAEKDFLNDAMERFSQATASQRLHQGIVSMALMIDPTFKQISIDNVPGLAHLLFKRGKRKPFRLLHAKVAILGFKHSTENNKWIIRLIVSTGNWTRQTIEESLDLVWSIEVASDFLKGESQQNCADIHAAYELLQDISTYFDMSLLEIPNSETKMNFKSFKSWMRKTIENSEGKPRFVDNRKQAFVKQLSSFIHTGRRNTLCMGSGFFGADENPAPLKIIETLKQEKLLTNNAIIDIYVNPEACQGIANWDVSSTKEHNIRIKEANTPEIIFGKNTKRTLHGKFIFSANQRIDSNKCGNPWLYIGSGNLTNAGFLNKMSSSGGNLEAGVIFSPEDLYWKQEKKTELNNAITNLLPINCFDESSLDINDLSEGTNSLDTSNEIHYATPIPWLTWIEHIPELRVPDGFNKTIEVFNLEGDLCHKKSKVKFLWLGDRPRQVKIAWVEDEKEIEGYVPVVDHYGRIAASDLPDIDIEEAWQNLDYFPMPPITDDESPEEGDGGYYNSHIDHKTVPQTTDYSIRKMMELIEKIADRQISIPESEWSRWCMRLNQILGQTKESKTVSYIREIGINTLSPLQDKPFIPNYIEGFDNDAGKLYVKTLSDIEKIWKIDKLDKLGQSDAEA